MTLAARLLGRFGLAAVLSALLMPVVAVAMYGVVWAGLGEPPGEFDRFGPAGASLLTGRWTEVYSDPGVQAGPLQLALYGIPAVLGVSGMVGWTAFATIAGYLLTLIFVLVLFAPRDISSARLARYVPLAVGAAAILGGVLPFAIWSGHPSQVVIPALWIVAGCLARENRFVAMGAVLGVSTGFEVWGVLGAAVVMLAARPGVVGAAAGGLAAVVVLYLPFVVIGPFRMFEKAWAIADGSLVGLLLPDLVEFPWGLRIAQTLIALAVGAGVALLTRRTDYGLWLVPLAVVTARLLLDPLVFPYYWLAPAAVGLWAVGALAMSREWWAPERVRAI